MSDKPGILIVDDESAMRRLMTDIIQAKTPYEAIPCPDGATAIEILRSAQAAAETGDRGKQGNGRMSDIRMVVTDLLMPGMDGEGVLEHVREIDQNLPVMVVTSHGSIDNAVNLVRKGASDYLTKPFTPAEFVQRVERILDNTRLKQENERLKERLQRHTVLGDVIGSSAGITKVLETVRVAALSDALVIIYGESGTGKEVIARTVHAMSPRAANSFVTVNCGALPETLLENELFGHVRGAYSDAHADRLGLVEEAEGGTLFLDEIGDITPAIQVKLLRFLQEKEFKRLGQAKTSKADVRIIAATNKDLQEEIRQGRFREDLYYRLNIIPMTLPPLRDRKDDIALLANHFLHKFATLYNRPAQSISARAMQKLISYDWPGNIRELENKIQQVVVLTSKRLIQAEDLELSGAPRNDRLFSKTLKAAKKELVDEFERNYISTLLTAHRGNVSRAARQAGKDRRAFFELMRKHRIDPGGFRQTADA